MPNITYRRRQSFGGPVLRAVKRRVDGATERFFKRHQALHNVTVVQVFTNELRSISLAAWAWSLAIEPDTNAHCTLYRTRPFPLPEL